MGLFDTVHVSGPGWTCPEGHDLTDCAWQTKDLGETLGTWQITASGALLVIRAGTWGEIDIDTTVRIYTSCQQCPFMMQVSTNNILDLWVEYELDIDVDGRRVQARRLVSNTLVQQIEYWKSIRGDGVLRTRQNKTEGTT